MFFCFFFVEINETAVLRDVVDGNEGKGIVQGNSLFFQFSFSLLRIFPASVCILGKFSNICTNGGKYNTLNFQ